MTKFLLKSLTGAAVLLLVSAQLASAGDGTCEEYGNEETAASETVPATPVPTADADYTRIAQIAPAAGNASTASAKKDAVEMAPPARNGDGKKKLTDSLPKEHQSSEAPGASVFETSDY